MPEPQLDYLKTAKKIRFYLDAYIKKYRITSLVVGISGGVDSALIAALTAPVCIEEGVSLIGRSIPIESNKKDENERANAIGSSLCTDYEEVDLTKMFKAMYEGSVLDSGDPIDRGNAKARLRMIYLYGLARQNGGIVLSTDNRTEMELGFWTLHGDVGDLGLIQNIWKTDIYNMLETLTKNDPLLNSNQCQALIPTLKCDATDGLGISKTDLCQILPDWEKRHKTSREGYAEVDERLKAWIKKKMDPNFPDMVITHDPIINRNRVTDGKRNSPFNFSLNDIAVYV